MADTNDNASYLASLLSSENNTEATTPVAPASDYDPAAQRSYLANVGYRFLDALESSSRAGRVAIHPFYESDAEQFQNEAMSRQRRNWALSDQTLPQQQQLQQLQLANGIADQQFAAQTRPGNQANALKQQQLTSTGLDNAIANQPQQNRLSQMRTQSEIDDLTDKNALRSDSNALRRYQMQNTLDTNYDKANADITNALSQQMRMQQFNKIPQFAAMSIPEQNEFMQSDSVQNLLKVQTAESLYYKASKDPQHYGDQLARFMQQNGLDYKQVSGGRELVADLANDKDYDLAYDNFAQVHNQVMQAAADELKARAMLSGAQASVKGGDLANLTTTLNPYIHSTKEQIQAVRQFYGTLQPDEINTHLLAAGLKTALSDGRLTNQEKQMLAPQLQSLAQQGGFKVELPSDGNPMNCQIIYSDGSRLTLPAFADDLQKRDPVPDKWNDYVGGIAVRTKEGQEYYAQQQAKVKFAQDKISAAKAGFDVGDLTKDPAQQRTLLTAYQNAVSDAATQYASTGDYGAAQKVYEDNMKKAGVSQNQIPSFKESEATQQAVALLDRQLHPLQLQSGKLAQQTPRGAPFVPNSVDNAAEKINAEPSLEGPGMFLAGVSTDTGDARYYQNLDQIQKLQDRKGELLAALSAHKQAQTQQQNDKAARQQRLAAFNRGK